MFLNFNKRKIFILLVSNLLLSMVFLFFSFYTYSVAMNAFEQGTASWFQNVLISIGIGLLDYLIALAFLLPEGMRDSFFGGVMSYVSAFIMTVPVTLLISFLIRKGFKGFRKKQG